MVIGGFLVISICFFSHVCRYPVFSEFRFPLLSYEVPSCIYLFEIYCTLIDIRAKRTPFSVYPRRTIMHLSLLNFRSTSFHLHTIGPFNPAPNGPFHPILKWPKSPDSNNISMGNNFMYHTYILIIFKKLLYAKYSLLKPQFFRPFPN